MTDPITLTLKPGDRIRQDGQSYIVGETAGDVAATPIETKAQTNRWLALRCSSQSCRDEQAANRKGRAKFQVFRTTRLACNNVDPYAAFPICGVCKDACLEFVPVDEPEEE